MVLGAELIKDKSVVLCDFDGMPGQTFPRMMRVKAAIKDLVPNAPSAVTILSTREMPEDDENSTTTSGGVLLTWIWDWPNQSRSIKSDLAVFISNTFKGTGKKHFAALKRFDDLKAKEKIFAEPASYPLTRRLYIRPGENDDIVIANEKKSFSFDYRPFSMLDRQFHRLRFTLNAYSVFPLGAFVLTFALVFMFLGAVYRYLRCLPLRRIGINEEFQRFRKYFKARCRYDGGIKDAYFKSMEGAFFENRPMTRPSLEIGVSGGNMTEQCLHKSPDIGMDPIGFLLADARKRDVCRYYLRADAREIPFGDETFSEVLFIDVFHHVPCGERAIDEIYRVLTTDGTFTFTTVSDYAVLRTLRGLWAYIRRDSEKMAKISEQIPLFNCRSLDQWQKLLELKGFQILEASHFCCLNHWFMFMAAFYLMHYFGTLVMSIHSKIQASSLGTIWDRLLLFISFSYVLNEKRVATGNPGQNLYLRCLKVPEINPSDKKMEKDVGSSL